MGDGKASETLKVLLGLTGSVASIKAVQLVSNLKSVRSPGVDASHRSWNAVEVRVVATERARHFFEEEELRREADEVHFDQDEWEWKDRGDPVLHIGSLYLKELHLRFSLKNNVFVLLLSFRVDQMG